MSVITQVTQTSENECWKNSRVTKALSQILCEIIQENNADISYKSMIEKQRKLIFNAKKPPSISIHEYLERILKYTHIEESTLIISLIYIDRVCESNDLILTQNNVHR
jgi:hypothetical protein